MFAFSFSSCIRAVTMETIRYLSKNVNINPSFVLQNKSPGRKHCTPSDQSDLSIQTQKKQKSNNIVLNTTYSVSLQDVAQDDEWHDPD